MAASGRWKSRARAAFGGVPTLERLFEGDGVVTARRLDALLWEVGVTLL